MGWMLAWKGGGNRKQKVWLSPEGDSFGTLAAASKQAGADGSASAPQQRVAAAAHILRAVVQPSVSEHRKRNRAALAAGVGDSGLTALTVSGRLTRERKQPDTFR